MKTKDLTQENIIKLTCLFPELITEIERDGKTIKTIDADNLKKIVGDYTDDSDEVYELTWAGKNKSRQKIVKPITKTLRPVPKDSVDFENTENLYIEGDNFEVLKLLQESYLNKIKMIYIDPPYNTGKDFVYKDKFSMSKGDYDEETGAVDEEGNKLFKNTTTNGRFHSDWLSMMFERLMIAKDLLKDDGVIFISIDDNEVHNLRLLMNVVFGEENCLGCITIVSNLKGRSDDKYYATAHNYLLVYTRGEFESIGVPLPEEYWDDYPETGEDGKRYRLIGLRKRGSGARREDRPNMFFSLFADKTSGKISLKKSSIFSEEVIPKLSDGLDGRWRWGKETVSNRIEDLIGKTVGADKRWDVFQIDSAENDEGIKRIKPKTIWTGSEFSNEYGTLETKKILGKNIFDNPKPTGLIKYCLEHATTNKDIILDFFSGSATTAHSVMQLNAEDGGNRKFILVQLPEETDKDSEASKAGYKNICEIGKERIRRAAKKIKEDNKGKDLSNVDFGFRVFKTDSSNMKDVYYNPNEIDQRTLANLKDNIKEERTDKDLLYQVLLELAVPISAKVKEEKANDKTIYRVNESFLVACFADDVDLETIKKIAELNPLRIVFKDSSFKDDSTKVNCFEYLKSKLFNGNEGDMLDKIKVI